MTDFGLIYNWYLLVLGFFIPTIIVLFANVSVLLVSRKVNFISLNAVSCVGRNMIIIHENILLLTTYLILFYSKTKKE